MGPMVRLGLWPVHGFCAPPWGAGGGGGRIHLFSFDTNTVVMLHIMTRPGRYCCNLVYSELIMLYIFL